MGDAAGALLGAAILVEASRRQVPRTTLVRIAANIALDTSVGAVPLVGDVFDAAWKSNRRNLQLLERHAVEPLKARRADRLAVGGLIALLIAISVGILVGVAVLSAAVINLVTGG